MRTKNKFLKTLLSVFMAVVLSLTGIPVSLPGITADSSTLISDVRAASAAEDNNLTEDIEDGAILHAWCWSFDTIRQNMADIAAAGFTTVQTSPANECKDTYPTMKLMGNDETNGTDGCWWWQYQPTDWKIGNYQLGTRADFIAMCQEADLYGIKVIVDVIPNHTTPDQSVVSQDLFNAAGGQLYHVNGFTPIQDDGTWTWSNREACTTGMMGGLPDVNTENQGFQKYFLEYLNDLIACGCDGFRYDTAKHIGVPSDPKDPGNTRGVNDFWPVVTGAQSVYGVSLSDADRIFTYGEVLQDTGVPETEYAEYMRMTASSYGSKLRGLITSNNFSVNSIIGWEHNTPESLVTWVESHDTYCNAHESAGLTDEQIRLSWAVIAARAKGTPLFFSRPDGSNGSSGNYWGNNVLGAKGNDQFKSAEVKAVNFFRNAMAGETEYLRNPNGNSKILQIDRGTKGTCIINLDGAQDLYQVATSLADGEYTDQVSGRTFTVSGGKLSGHLDGRKVAVIYHASHTDYSDIIDGSYDLYFEKPASWGRSIYCYASVDGQSNNGTWPGQAMTYLGENIYAYNLPSGWQSAKVIFSDGSNQVPGANQAGLDYTKGTSMLYADGTFTEVQGGGGNEEIIDGSYDIYFKKPSGWGSNINCYAYIDEQTNNGSWPGQAMTSLGSDVYAYNLPSGWQSAYVIFNDGSNQVPGANQQGLSYTKGTSMLYENGTFTEVQGGGNEEEESVIDGTYGIYFEKPSGWGSTIYCYAYTDAGVSNATWPGVQMESLGDDIYGYNIPSGWQSASVIFSDGTRQAPASNQPGFAYTSGTYMLYSNGSFTEVEINP